MACLNTIRQSVLCPALGEMRMAYLNNCARINHVKQLENNRIQKCAPSVNVLCVCECELQCNLRTTEHKSVCHQSMYFVRVNVSCNALSMLPAGQRLLHKARETMDVQQHHCPLFLQNTLTQMYTQHIGIGTCMHAHTGTHTHMHTHMGTHTQMHTHTHTHTSL